MEVRVWKGKEEDKREVYVKLEQDGSDVDIILVDDSGGKLEAGGIAFFKVEKGKLTLVLFDAPDSEYVNIDPDSDCIKVIK